MYKYFISYTFYHHYLHRQVYGNMVHVSEYIIEDEEDIKVIEDEHSEVLNKCLFWGKSEKAEVTILNFKLLGGGVNSMSDKITKKDLMKMARSMVRGEPISPELKQRIKGALESNAKIKLEEQAIRVKMGNRLASLRRSAGYDQSFMQDEGMSRDIIAGLELGRVFMKFPHALRLAKKLKVTPAYFYDVLVYGSNLDDLELVYDIINVISRMDNQQRKGLRSYARYLLGS